MDHTFSAEWCVVATIDGVEATSIVEVDKTHLRKWEPYANLPEIVSAQYRVWGPKLRIRGKIHALDGAGKVNLKLILYLKKTEQ